MPNLALYMLYPRWTVLKSPSSSGRVKLADSSSPGFGVEAMERVESMSVKIQDKTSNACEQIQYSLGALEGRVCPWGLT